MVRVMCFKVAQQKDALMRIGLGDLFCQGGSRVVDGLGRPDNISGKGSGGSSVPGAPAVSQSLAGSRLPVDARPAVDSCLVNRILGVH